MEPPRTAIGRNRDFCDFGPPRARAKGCVEPAQNQLESVRLCQHNIHISYRKYHSPMAHGGKVLLPVPHIQGGGTRACTGRPKKGLKPYAYVSIVCTYKGQPPGRLNGPQPQGEEVNQWGAAGCVFPKGNPIRRWQCSPLRIEHSELNSTYFTSCLASWRGYQFL